MDDISLALNPPRFARYRRSPIKLPRSTSKVWPLAAINGREPNVLLRTVRGVELAYPRYDAGDAIATCPSGTPNGTSTHIMPTMTSVHAVDDGLIVFAGRLGHRYGMIIDHGNGWCSHYANLAGLCAIRTDLHRPRPQRVRAGDSIGYVGSPEPGAFCRLYFELWQRNRSRDFVPVDPLPHLEGWEVRKSYDEVTPAPPVVLEEAA